MPPWFNATNLTGSNTFVEILQYANTTTVGWYGVLFILGFFSVLFIAFKSLDVKKSFAAASFISAIIAILLRSINLLNELAILVAFVFVAIGMMTLFWERTAG